MMLEQQWYNRLGSARLGSARLGSAALLVTLALLALALLLAAPPAGAQQTTDYDADDDGLIEIRTPAQLNALRHDLNGNGDATHADYVAAFADRDTTPATLMGCPSGTCTGYELRDDLDLSTDYPAWTPLGNYSATFDGNGYAISGLTINTTGNDDAGLFTQLSGSGVIRNLGLVAPSVSAAGNSRRAGGVVSTVDQNAVVETSYVLGGTLTVRSGLQLVGGLVGRLEGTVRASYSTAAIVMASPCSGCNSHRTGGLVGFSNGGKIIASYATGRNAASGIQIRAGGLVGSVETVSGNTPAITDSYCNSQTTGRNCIGQQSGVTVASAGYTTRELRRPTQYTGTIYANWNIDLDGDPMTDDDPWDFGTHRNYPLLKADKNGDGRATCEEFSGQPCYRAPGPPPYNPAHDHPEIYANPRYEMATACAVQTTGTGDDAKSTATLTFDLGAYTRPLTLALSLWDGTHFRSLQSQNIAMPELRQEGQTATVEVVTDPAKTRFRIDSQYGLNLVLGYADCHTDDP